MKRNMFFLLTAFGIVGFFSSCTSKTSEKKPINRNLVSAFEGYIVKPAVVDQTILVSGTLRAFEETVLMPEITGRVVKINLPEGKFVKQGTLLVKLFDEDLQAQMKKSQAQLQIAEQTEKRQRQLIEVNGISQSDYDATVLQVNSIRADIEVLKVQIRKTEVMAPFDGVIGLRNISIGAEVTPSTALATIRQVARLKLDFSVPEKYSRNVAAGRKVRFSVQGDAKDYEATVIASEEGIDVSTRNLKARAELVKTSPSLVPGAFANVQLQLGENKNALMVPTQAIIPQERNKKLIVAKKGLAKFVPVNTGVRQDTLIEVLNGLAPGDTVITTGILFIKPGMKLKFSKVK